MEVRGLGSILMVLSAGLFVVVVVVVVSPCILSFPPAPSFLCAPSSPLAFEISTLRSLFHPYRVVAVAVQTFTGCCLSVCLSVLDLSADFVCCVSLSLMGRSQQSQIVFTAQSIH